MQSRDNGGRFSGARGANRPAVRIGSSLHIHGSIAINIARDAKTNLLLAALPEAESKRWLPQLEQVDMPLGEVLYESGATLSQAAASGSLSGRAGVRGTAMTL